MNKEDRLVHQFIQDRQKQDKLREEDEEVIAMFMAVRKTRRGL